MAGAYGGVYRCGPMASSTGFREISVVFLTTRLREPEWPRLSPPGQSGDATIAVRREHDIVEARSRAREAATGMGFSAVDSAVITACVSELARNIVSHAGNGEILLRCDGACLTVEATDAGPGIDDLDRALAPGFSSSGAAGLGLASAWRGMDELTIISGRGHGTRILARKWL